MGAKLFAWLGGLALFLGVRFGVTAATIGYFFAYIGVLSVVTRALFLGPAHHDAAHAHLRGADRCAERSSRASRPLARALLFRKAFSVS